MRMESSASTRSRWWHAVGAAAIGAIWWVAFHQHDAVPILTYVNFGIHELGHLVTYGFSDLVTALTGSAAQVGIPLLLGAYFLLRGGDWLAAGLCLAWAGSAALEVAVYVADAPYQQLQLVGGQHDWAFILGPDGYGAMHKAAWLAEATRDGALVAIIMGFVFSVAGLVREPAYTTPAPPTSLAKADSSAWPASATSGSASRSASSPQYTPPS